MQRGTTHPLDILATQLVRELEKVGHFDFDHDNYFPLNEGIAITSVYSGLLDAEAAGVILVPEQ